MPQTLVWNGGLCVMPSTRKASTPNLAKPEPNRALMGAGIPNQQICNHSALIKYQNTVYRKAYGSFERECRSSQ
jgi:hypothetical protein